MHRKTHIVVLLILAFFILLLGGIGAYDFFVFQAYRGDILQVLTQADPQDREAPELIRRYIKESNVGLAGISGRVSRQLLVQLDPPRLIPFSHNLSFELALPLWSILLNIHFPEHEVLGLYCSLPDDGITRGANSFAMGLFGRPLNALSEEEASIVAVKLTYPEFYASHRDILQRHSQKLLGRYRSHYHGNHEIL